LEQTVKFSGIRSFSGESTPQNQPMIRLYPIVPHINPGYAAFKSSPFTRDLGQTPECSATSTPDFRTITSQGFWQSDAKKRSTGSGGASIE